MMASAFNVLGGWCVVERKVGGRGEEVAAMDLWRRQDVN